MSRSIDRRDVLKTMGASLLLGLPRAASSAEAASGKRWSCTNQDCDPYIYDPSLGAENAIDPDHPIPPAFRSRTFLMTGYARYVAIRKATSYP